jgi:hypothetical protein
MSDRAPKELSVVLVSLLKGIIEREASAPLWQGLLAQQARVRDHIGLIGLELVLDEAEGYAYLRQKPQPEGELELPRLVARRQLSYPVSLLLALLRKKLAEFDATSGDTRLVVSSAEILDMIRLFLPDTANQAKLKDRLESDIGRIVELGFLRPLKGRGDTYEVRRILRSFVDAQWLGQLSERLGVYADHGAQTFGAEAASAHE